MQLIKKIVFLINIGDFPPTWTITSSSFGIGKQEERRRSRSLRGTGEKKSSGISRKKSGNGKYVFLDSRCGSQEMGGIPEKQETKKRKGKVGSLSPKFSLLSPPIFN